MLVLAFKSLVVSRQLMPNSWFKADDFAAA